MVALDPDGSVNPADHDAVNHIRRRQITKRLTADGEPDREVGCRGPPGRAGHAAPLAVEHPIPRGTVVGGDLEGVPDRDHSGEVETAGRQGLTGSGEQVDSGGHIETGGQPTTASVFWMVAYPLVFEVPDSEAMPHQGPRPDWRPGRHSKPSARTRHG